MENPTEEFNETKWSSLKKDLKASVGESAYNNWLKHLTMSPMKMTQLLSRYQQSF